LFFVEKFLSFSAATAEDGIRRLDRAGVGAFRIGAYLVKPDLNLIDGPTGQTLLEHKAIAVLLYMAARPGKVVSAEELIRAVWMGRPMGDNPVYR
jgi:DNA-binding winged helix-turn-helix (wHTH) protein